MYVVRSFHSSAGSDSGSNISSIRFTGSSATFASQSFMPYAISSVDSPRSASPVMNCTLSQSLLSCALPRQNSLEVPRIRKGACGVSEYKKCV
eukprot:scaffold17319_cov99-Phaeocystis_antarctica.AAC.5